MGRFFPIFFLVIMSLNVAVPFVERLLDKNWCELLDFKKGEKEEKGKTEKEENKQENKENKEEGKEKEPLSFLNHAANQLNVGELKRLKKSLFSTDERLISELFAFAPERPPAA